MTALRRKLLLQVAAGDDRAMPYLHQLDRLGRCESVLEWLIDRRYTGSAFVQWVAFNYRNNALEAGLAVLKEIDGREMRPVHSRGQLITR